MNERPPAAPKPLSPFIAQIPTLASGLMFLYFLRFIEPVSAGETIRIAWEWAPSLGVSLSFIIDGLSLIFALLITGIGAIIFLYSNSYLGKKPQFDRFILFLFAFELSMLGLVLADNLIALFVFWELTTVTSYLLIGFNHAEPRSRRNALQALLVTGMGGLALLAGLILMGSVAGTFEISEINAQGDVLREHALYTAITILVLAGAFTKSAQIPFHFWLPNAMAAPTPVSAYLHSATMVKAGVYLMARLHPSLSGTDLWLWSLTIAGAITAVWASILALRQRDLKQALAYTTLMALGALTLFLAADATIAITAAATFLVVHSLYKAALFLVVGCVDQQTGTREVTRLRGLGRAMPITAAAAAISGLSMAGFPPLIGFIGKELKYKGALAVASEPVFVAAAALLANALMVAVAAILVWRVFYSKAPPADPTPIAKTPGEPAISMWIGPVLLAALGLAFGVAPGLIGEILIEPAVIAISGGAADVELKIWHGVNLPLILSIVTFALGGLIYAYHVPIRRWLIAMERSLFDMDRFWDRFMDGLKALAAWQTRILQSGVLRLYLMTVFATIAFGLIGTWVAVGAAAPTLAALGSELASVPVKHYAIAALLVAGAVTTLVARSRIAAIAGLGVVGIAVALFFIVFGAPDVAITQLLVETLVVVLVAVALLRLPLLENDPGPLKRPAAALVAIAMGVMASLLVIAATRGPLDLTLTAFFQEASWPQAFGRNIVNVILVDFRAIDTFGEIAVVVVAALGAFALLKGVGARRPAGGDADAAHAPAHDGALERAALKQTEAAEADR
ncbi:MAG: putative monovalent cation/H+ antiporter subunit A [Pseudomonadota bacterium]